jgi:hypothetical protein
MSSEGGDYPLTAYTELGYQPNSNLLIDESSRLKADGVP